MFLQTLQPTIQKKAFTLPVCPRISSEAGSIPLFLIYGSAAINWRCFRRYQMSPIPFIHSVWIPSAFLSIQSSKIVLLTLQRRSLPVRTWERVCMFWPGEKLQVWIGFNGELFFPLNWLANFLGVLLKLRLLCKLLVNGISVLIRLTFTTENRDIVKSLLPWGCAGMEVSYWLLLGLAKRKPKMRTSELVY